MRRKKKKVSRTAIPEVSFRQIEVLGNKLAGRRVKLCNCRLAMVEKYDEDRMRFGLFDVDSNIFPNCYASLDAMGEFVASIEPDAFITVSGFVSGGFDFTELGLGVAEMRLWVDKIYVRGKMRRMQW